MSVQPRAKRLSVRKFMEMKGREPIVCLTAYTAPVASLLDGQVDLMLVGDSLGNVVYGLETTVPVPLEWMIAHGRAVVRASERTMVIVDLPFGSYEESPEAAFRSASRVLKETGATGVKLEGGATMAPTIRFLSDRGVPVMGHVGLLPQQVNRLGYRVAGRADGDREALLADVRAVTEAGAFCIVVEGTVEALAAEAAAATPVPVIGIGASAKCDGQILVVDDMLGLSERAPAFVKRYAEIRRTIGDAVAAYAADVRARRFPGPEHAYGPGPRPSA